MEDDENENVIDASDITDNLFEEAEDDPRSTAISARARREMIGPSPFSRRIFTPNETSKRKELWSPRGGSCSMLDEPRGASCSMRLPCDGNWHDVPEPGMPLSTVRGIYARLLEPPVPYDKNLGTIDFQAGYLVVFERLPLWVAEVGYQLPLPAKAIVGNGNYFRFRFNEVCPGRVLELFISIVTGG